MSSTICHLNGKLEVMDIKNLQLVIKDEDIICGSELSTNLTSNLWFRTFMHEFKA